MVSVWRVYHNDIQFLAHLREENALFFCLYLVAFNCKDLWRYYCNHKWRLLKIY